MVNVIGNYIFIPLWGARAAAGTTAVCGLTILILLLFKVDENIKLEKVGKLIVAPLFGSIGIVVVCLLCKWIDNLWIRVFVSLTASTGMTRSF